MRCSLLSCTNHIEHLWWDVQCTFVKEKRITKRARSIICDWQQKIVNCSQNWNGNMEISCFYISFDEHFLCFHCAPLLLITQPTSKIGFFVSTFSSLPTFQVFVPLLAHALCTTCLLHPITYVLTHLLLFSSFYIRMYPCSTKTREVLGNPSLTRETSWGRSLREILRVKGNLEGRGDGFPNTYQVLVERGHFPHH